MKYTEAVTCVLDGLTLANETYEKWSGGDWMGRAGVEGFLVAKIGERLHDRITANGVDEYITLETSMKEAREYSDSETSEDAKYTKKILGKDTKKIFGDSKRLDITLWNKHRQPQGVFEIKRLWNDPGCFNDLLRVAAMVHEHGGPEGSIKWGFAAFFVNCVITKGDKALHERTAQYEGKIRDEFKNYDISKKLSLKFNYGPIVREPKEPKEDKENKWSGQGVCMAVKPKKKRK